MKLANQPLLRLRSRVARPATRQRRRWTAITLRWRSAGRRLPRPSTRPPSPSISHYWVTQFNLHFGGAHPTVDHLRPVSAAPMQMTRLYWCRTTERTPGTTTTVRQIIDRERRRFTGTSETNVVLRFSAIRGKQVARTFPEVSRVVPRTRLPKTPGAGMLQATIELAHERRRFRLSERGALSAARRLASRAAAATVQVRWAGETPRGLASIRPRRQAPPQAPALHAGRDLVWRIQERDRVLEPDKFAPARAAATPANVQTMGTAMAAALPAQAAALQRQQALDPAIVERLTDDVINRVERRLRIERERRGL